MKLILSILIYFVTVDQIFAQSDSVSFEKNNVVFDVKELFVDEITVNKVVVKSAGEKTKYLSINSKCNFVAPNYDQLTGTGWFAFKRLKSDAEVSLSGLGSSLTFEKKSDYYIFYFKRSKTFECTETNNIVKKVEYGVGAYIIFKVSNVKGKINISTPYDITAASHLQLLDVEIDVRTIGMTPSLQNEFIPDKVSDIDIESAKYFDKIITVVKTLMTNKNTAPSLLPLESPVKE